MQNCQLKLNFKNYNKIIKNGTNMKTNTSMLLTSSVYVLCCVLLDSERSLVQTEL